MSVESDQLIIEQQESIRKDIVESQLLIGDLADVSVLLESYKSADLPGFVPGIQYLGKVCTFMRKVRGDGNCFYRSFLFGYLDILLKLYETGDEALVLKCTLERDRFLLIVKNSLAELVLLGYSEFTIECFYEVSSCDVNEE
jgi:ubiquitin thioesterase protein OTUB1